MRIGVFDPTCNPFTTPHRAVIRTVAEHLEIAKTLVTTPNAHLWKPGILSKEHRLKMLELGVEGLPNVEVIRELALQDRVYSSFQIVAEAMKRYPGADIFYCIGSDNLARFDEWMDAMRIIRYAKLAVVIRQPDGWANFVKAFEKDSPMMWALEHNRLEVLPPVQSFSATQAREMIARGEDVGTMIPTNVLAYIKEQNLFGPETRLAAVK